MSNPGHRFVVEVLDASGNVLGEGPLYNVISAEVTEELDRTGKVTVTVPASDARAIALLQNDRQIRVLTADGAVGHGIIQDFTVVGGAQPLYKVSGPSILGELNNHNSGYETVFENETVETGIIGDDSDPETLLGGTGWDPGTIDATLTTTTIGFVGQSVLEALTMLATQLGRHFRLGTVDRTIDFDTFGADSGIRISNVHHILVAQEDNDSLVYVGDVQIGTISGDIENRIFPLGKNRFDIRYASSGNTVGVQSNPGPLFAEAASTVQANFNTYAITVGDATGFTGGQVVWIGDRDDWSADKETNEVQSVAGNVITLVNPLAFTYPIGTDVVQRPMFYIEDAASVASRGVHEAVWTFPWVQPYTGLSFSLEQASDVLYDMAAARLERFKDPYKSYQIGELYGLPQSLKVGETVRFVYRGAVKIDGTRTYYVDEDADFHVVKVTRRYHGTGMAAASIEIANVSRPAPSNAQAVTDNVATTRMLAAGESQSPAPSTTIPGPSGHPPLALGTDAEAILDLTGVGGQTLELDSQAANTVFAGPVSGGDADPDFRALVFDDLPALDIDDLGNTDLADPGADRIVFWDDSDSAYEWLTPGAGLSITINILNVDHDAANNFVASEHINHTSVSINAGGILSGGGDISASRTISLAHGDVDHDQTMNFVANEHINHTSVSINAGGILSGGGDISASRTISLAHSDVDHDQTTGFVANEHINHASVSISAGNGLTGGGTIAANRTITLGTPSTLAVATGNAVTSTSHTHSITSTSDGETNASTILQSGASGDLRLNRLGVGMAPTADDTLMVADDVRIAHGLYVGATNLEPLAGTIYYTLELRSVKAGATHAVYGFCPLGGSTSTSYDGDTVSANGTIDLQSGWTTNIPVDAQAVAVRLNWQSDTVGRRCALKESSSGGQAITCRTQVADVWEDAAGIVPCDNGDIYIEVTGSGQVYIEIFGYFI